MRAGKLLPFALSALLLQLAGCANPLSILSSGHAAQNATLGLTPLPNYFTNSSITGTTPTNADGVSTATITINLIDDNFNPLVGVVPAFAATDTHGSNYYVFCTPTDHFGSSQCEMTSAYPETKTLSITSPISLAGGSIVFNNPSGPDHMALIAGDAQTTNAGTNVAVNPKVQVVDSGGAAVAGVPLSFTVTQGGGSVGTSSTVTDAGGFASTTFKLGPNPGTNKLVVSKMYGGLPDVANTGNTSITFTETGN